MSKKNKSSNVKYIIGIIVIVLIAVFGSKYGIEVYNSTETTNTEENTQKLVSVEESNDNLKVHFIDVGQADCILLEQSGHFMLIDAGNNDDGNLVLDYLKNKGVTKLDYVIGTHAHEDHIGGIDDVINNFDEDKIFFPKTSNTTKTFEDFVKAVKNKNKKLYAPKSGEEFTFANSTFKVLAPNSESYEDANDYSIVI